MACDQQLISYILHSHYVHTHTHTYCVVCGQRMYCVWEVPMIFVVTTSGMSFIHIQHIHTHTHTHTERQWYYQTCTEFGYFQTTDSDNQSFGSLVNLDSFTDVCSDVFNISQSAVLQAVYNTNDFYGGKNIPTNVTNIVFPNGSIDPWHVLGITQNITDQLPAIFITGTAHCANMYPPSPNDLPELTNARMEITTLIGTWLAAV